MPYESRAKGDVLTILYASAAWKQARKDARDRDDHRCVQCHNPANSVHHKDPGARALIAMGEDPCDPTWLATLCASCHGAADTRRTPPKPNRFLGTVLARKA